MEKVCFFFGRTMSNKIKHLYAFEDFRLDTETSSLWQDGELVSVSPKALDVLVLLVERSGEIVSREELLEKVWHETFVEEANINYTISLLRKSLGENNFIQTVPKRGYRFVAEVTKIEEKSSEEVSEKKEILVRKDNEPETFPTQSASKKGRWVLAVVTVFSIIFLTSFAFYSWNKNDAQSISVTNRNIKTLAVLPFKNLTDDEDDNSIALGLTDSLISRLGSLKRFTMRPLSAVEKFAKSQKDALEFGKELKCDAVLVGTFQTVENRLRVNARLLDVRDGSQILTLSFNETESDIFALQNNLATQIAASLLEKLTDSDEKLLGKEYTENAEAYRAYLRGRMLFERPKGDSFERILDEYQKAISLDPTFALAYSALADLFVRRGNLLSGAEGQDAYKKARIYAQKALQLDSDLAQANTSMARVKRIADWDWDGAEVYLKRAIELNPNDANAHLLYGHIFIFRGDYDSAVKMLDRAVEIDPITPVSITLLFRVFEANGDFDEGLRRSQAYFEFDKEIAIARVAYARFLFHQREYEKVIEIVEESLEKPNSFDNLWFTLLSASYRHLGQIEKADEYLRKIEEDAAKNTRAFYFLAIVYAELGRSEEAIRTLEKCFDLQEELVVWMNTEPSFSSLKNDSRFQNLLNKLNLI